MGKGVQWHNTQFCDLRSRGLTRRGRWKPTMNGKGAVHASNPDIDTSRSTISTSSSRMAATTISFRAASSRPDAAPAQGQHSVCGHADYRQPEFFKGKSPKEIAAYFQRAADFLIDRVGRENIVSAMVHMDEKTPHLHLVFGAADKGQPPVRQRNYRQPGQSDEVAGRFSCCMVEQYPDRGAWGKRQQDGPEAYPHPAVQTGGQSFQTGEGHRQSGSLRSITPLNAGKEERGSPLHAEKVVSADGELLRVMQQGYNQ